MPHLSFVSIQVDTLSAIFVPVAETIAVNKELRIPGLELYPLH